MMAHAYGPNYMEGPGKGWPRGKKKKQKQQTLPEK
jgi:hypothetical protein